MKYRLIVATVASLGLSNCAIETVPLNPGRLVTDSDTDMAVQLFMQATLLLTKYYGHDSVYRYDDIVERSSRAGYRTLPFMPPQWVRATPPLSEFAFKIDDDLPTFRQKVEDTIGYNGLIKYYIRTGWNASQIICRNYLLNLAERNQYLQFLQEQYGVFHSLAVGILALAHPNHDLQSAFALANVAINGFVDKYQDYRFLTVDREAARALVEAAQNKYAEYFLQRVDESKISIKKNGAVSEVGAFTFSEALNAVNVFEYQCTREGIRALVSRAVNNSPTNIEIDKGSASIIFRSAIEARPSGQTTTGTTKTTVTSEGSVTQTNTTTTDKKP